MKIIIAIGHSNNEKKFILCTVHNLYTILVVAAKGTGLPVRNQRTFIDLAPL